MSSSTTRLPQRAKTPTKQPTSIPRSRTKSTTKASGTPVKKPLAVVEDLPPTPSIPRLRTKSTTKAGGTPVKKSLAVEDVPPTPSAPKNLSIKEAIALRRAQAKAEASKLNALPNRLESLEFASPNPPARAEEEDILGRLPLRETIERARTTGSLNIATRSLPCIPSALFEIHLGITPEPLKSVPDEPKLPPVADDTLPTLKAKSPSWYDSQDLTILKAWHNDIAEIQPEISLFGSLKVVDLHLNKITSLPKSFCDLVSLVTLDLSTNSLQELPADIFSLPKLTTLNISHNALTSLPFGAPFSKKNMAFNSDYGSLFGPTVTRASSALPLLITLDTSHNQITASNIDLSSLPVSLSKLDLSSNPLGSGKTAPFINALGRLAKLKELRFEKADIDDSAFTTSDIPSFPALRVLDLGQTRVTQSGIAQALPGMKVKQTVSFDFTNEEPPLGTLQVVIGKKVIKEAWELDLEQNSSRKSKWYTPTPEAVDQPTLKLPQEKASASQPAKRPEPTPPKFEAWEIEAQQGLLTEGGKRRARAAAAAAALEKEKAELEYAEANKTSSTASSLAHSQYYNSQQATLTLPSSAPPSRMAGKHARAFSLASPSMAAAASSSNSDITIPTPTLPLTLIAAQSFAATLKILILKNRRMDRSFSLPENIEQPLLPRLVELSLEGCSLTDEVAVSRGTDVLNTSTKPILPLLSSLFPSLRILDLSHNTLTGAAFSKDALTSLLINLSSSTPGLRSLLLRGNRIDELDGFKEIAETLFTGHRDNPGWALDELDVRDNNIKKIPYEVGLLPLDVLLVEGNILPPPQKRIAEREGTKGLLVYLRACIGT